MHTNLLYKQAAPIVIENKIDERPQNPHDVYEYVIDNGYANPFGIVMHGLNVHAESMYSGQLPIGKLQTARLIISTLLKNKVAHHGDALSITHAYYDNFYHFSMECLIKIFLLRKHLEQNSTVIIMPKRQLRFHKEWFDLLNLSEKVLTVEDAEIVSPRKIVTCSFSANSSNQHREIINDFREWVLNKIQRANKNKPRYKKIFIGRKFGSRRNIKNRGEVIDVFERHGFAYLEMDNISLGEQINIFMNATHIAGIHGAALSNITFARRDAQLIELMNEELHVHFFEKICSALMIPYINIQCKQVAGLSSQNHADIEVDIHNLNLILSGL